MEDEYDYDDNDGYDDDDDDADSDVGDDDDKDVNGVLASFAGGGIRPRPESLCGPNLF